MEPAGCASREGAPKAGVLANSSSASVSRRNSAAFAPNRDNRSLIVVIDGDRRGVQGRLADFEDACRARGVPARAAGESVLLLVPTWRIETWLAYLDGVDVDESRPDYPRLARERDCQRHVEVLAGMCRGGALRAPIPPSLDAACAEYWRLRGLRP